MAKKINLDGVKDFFFNHGEKVALGTCAALALTFAILGLMDAAKAGKAPSGKPWTSDLKDQHDIIAAQFANRDVPKLTAQAEKALNPTEYEWHPVKTDFKPLPYIHVGEKEDSKRKNPMVLPIRTNAGKKVYCQLDYVPALFLVHDVNSNGVKKLEEENAGGNNAGAGPAMKKGPGGPPRGGAGNNQGDVRFLRAADARRMVVGHVVFPMKDQVLEFQRAFKMASQKELFDQPREDLPCPVGFNLVKYEFLANGQPAKKEPEYLLKFDGKTLYVAANLKKFLSRAMYDDKDAAALAPYIWEGLTMPLPQLAYGNYPPVALEGIQLRGEEGAEPVPGGGAPKKPGGLNMKLPGFGGKQGPTPKGPGMEDKGGAAKDDGPTYRLETMTQKELRAYDEVLGKRLIDADFNIYHVFGRKRPEPGAEPAGAQGQPRQNFGPPRPGMAGGGGVQDGDYFSAWGIDMPKGEGVEDKKPAAPPIGGVLKGPKGPGVAADPKDQFPNWERDAVVRFIDIDVEPGRKYQYVIQIRMKNPNKDKKDLVAFNNLAIPEELEPSAWVMTEFISIPNEYYLYAFDQQLYEDGRVAADKSPGAKESTVFQIHKWEKTYTDQGSRADYPIGDWAIAERVVVHKGARIGYDSPGQQDVIVSVPFWAELKDRFDLSKQRLKGSKAGIRMSLPPPSMANDGLLGDSGFPILVDFTGGKESAVDALVIGPNGKLRVLNSRDAADLKLDTARQRNERLVRARQRVAEMQGTPAQKNAPKGLPGFDRN